MAGTRRRYAKPSSAWKPETWRVAGRLEQDNETHGAGGRGALTDRQREHSDDEGKRRVHEGNEEGGDRPRLEDGAKDKEAPRQKHRREETGQRPSDRPEPIPPPTTKTAEQKQRKVKLAVVSPIGEASPTAAVGAAVGVAASVSWWYRRYHYYHRILRALFTSRAPATA